MVFQVLFMAAIISSFTTIVVITFDRLLHVYYLTKYRVNNKIVCLVLIGLSVALFLLTYFAGGTVALVYFIVGISAMIGAYIGMILTLRIHHINISVSFILHFKVYHHFKSIWLLILETGIKGRFQSF